MNYLVVISLLVLILLLTTTREKFTEAFGLSGYTKPTKTIKLVDPRPDLSKYTKMDEVSVDNDMMEEFVLKANKEISKRTDLCTYIIETTAVHQYKGEEKDIYECMFMTMKKGGFSFGFSVVASYEVENGKIRLMSLRSQPLGVEAPSDITPYTEGSSGKEFVDYKLVREIVVPTKAELDSVKNKLE